MLTYNVYADMVIQGNFTGLSAASCKTQVRTYIPGGGAVTFDLAASDEVPHTGHPVGQEGKRGHEQGQDHGAVLGVTVQLL